VCACARAGEGVERVALWCHHAQNHRPLWTSKGTPLIWDLASQKLRIFTRRAAERDGSAFGRSRHSEVMVFLRPSRTVLSVRPWPRPFTCFPVHCGPILCHYQCCQMYHSVRARCLSVRPSVRPSVRVEQLSSHWTDCHEILYLTIFRKICPPNSSFVNIWHK
jgi:hypothetical protein